MKIKYIRWGKLVSEGFNNKKLEMEASVCEEAEDTPEKVLKALQDKVDMELGIEPTLPFNKLCELCRTCRHSRPNKNTCKNKKSQNK
jgi:hypothetical protein